MWRDGFSRERAQADAAAELRRRPRRLDAGVPGADDNDIEFSCHWITMTVSDS